ncbi:MAG: methionine gamma-lyase family protein [Firmicutes bacterium]|nr:methionine gamma-lyase family protein [Bacillota bacterium]
MNHTYQYLKEEFDIDEKVLNLVAEAEEEIRGEFDKLDDIMAYNQYKVLKAFQKNRIRDMHFGWKTGYGYDDAGREAIEQTFADVFHTDAALVRTTFVNGTHALATTLLGILRPGDELIYATGEPYDTLQTVIGLTNYEKGNGSLRDYGVTFKQVDLLADGSIDIEGVKAAITDKTRMITAQRATGYSWRKAISIDEIERLMKAINEVNPNIVKMVDNSYGEFLDTKEPTDVGADVMASSLIKNPGGGLALSGAYIAGRQDLIDQIQYRMTCPGIGGECGLTYGQTRTMFQGFFLGPKATNGALKGAVLCGKAFEKLGFEVSPKAGDVRSDIVQAVKCGDPQKLIAFCEGIQAAAPIDSFVSPVPGDMPGYEDKVIMAAGAFVQGSTIELSANAPMREPYIAYFQGGLTYEHSKFGVIKAMDTMVKKGLVTIE